MLQDLAARLAIPGLPDWVGLVLLLLGALVALAYLLMPFSVFGVKSRLDTIEAQLDEIQTDLRSLALRMAEAPPPARAGHRAAVVEDDWIDPPSSRSRGEAYSPPRATPPVPPPAHWPDAPPPPPQQPHRSGAGGGRAEPRLDWPRGGGGGRGAERR